VKALSMKLLLLNKIAIVTLLNRSKPGKQVNLTEAEVRGLCIKARDIFINQPILLELEAPIKICGK
jgi:hypothetical protein